MPEVEAMCFKAIEAVCLEAVCLDAMLWTKPRTYTSRPVEWGAGSSNGRAWGDGGEVHVRAGCG